jgi:hypothetical protein
VATDPNAATTDTHIDGGLFTEDPRVDNDAHSELPDPPPCQHQPFNRQGMVGNQNHHNQHYVRILLLKLNFLSLLLIARMMLRLI